MFIFVTPDVQCNYVNKILSVLCNYVNKILYVQCIKVSFGVIFFLFLNMSTDVTQIIPLLNWHSQVTPGTS